MATIRNIPTVSPERGPVVFQNPGDTRGAFGERQADQLVQAGQQLQQFGGQLGDKALELDKANERIDLREDALARAKALRAAQGEIDELVRRESEGDNFATEKSVKAFRDGVAQALRRAQDDASRAFKRPQISNLDFATQLEELNSKYSSFAVNESLKGTQELLSQQLSERSSFLGQVVADDPTQFDNAVSVYLMEIERDFAPGHSDAQVELKRREGLEIITRNAVNFYVTNRAYDRATALLNHPSVKGKLSKEAVIGLNIKIAAGRGEKARAEAQINSRLQILQDAGVKLSPEQLDRVKAAIITGTDILKPPAAKLTTMEKVANFTQTMRLATGNPNFMPTPNDVRGIASAGKDTLQDPFPSQGAGAKFLAENHLDFRYRVGSPEDDRMFLEVATSVATQTGPFGTTRSLSDSVRESLLARGFDPDALGKFTPAQGRSEGTGVSPTAVFQSEAAQALGGANLHPGELGAQGDAVSEAGSVNDISAQQQADQDQLVGDVAVEQASGVINETLAPLEQAREQQDVSTVTPDSQLQTMATSGVQMWHVADKLTGFFATIQRGVSEVEFIGDLFPNDELTRLEQQFELFKSAAAQALQRTDRFALGERREIKAEDLQGIDTGLLKRPGALQARLEGLDGFLRLEASNIRGALADPRALSDAERATLTDRLRVVGFIRDFIGAPIVVSSPEELQRVIQEERLPAGTWIKADGQLRQIKEGQGFNGVDQGQ